MLQCNWSFWYTSGLLFFVAHSILFRPALLSFSSSRQLLLLTFGYPVYYVWVFHHNFVDSKTRWSSVAVAISTVVFLSTAVFCEHHIRVHAQDHAQMRLKADRVIGDDEMLLVTGNSPLDEYLNHISPFNDYQLPFWHRVEHRIIRFLESFQMFDIDLDGFVDSSRFRELAFYRNRRVKLDEGWW